MIEGARFVLDYKHFMHLVIFLFQHMISTHTKDLFLSVHQSCPNERAEIPTHLYPGSESHKDGRRHIKNFQMI